MKVVIVTSTQRRNLQLHFPADNGYLRVCRLAATTLAAEVGLDVDELDDVRLAVAEVVNYLVESPEGGEIVLRLHVDGDGFQLEGRLVGGPGPEPPVADESAVSPLADSQPGAVEIIDDSDVDDLLHAVLGATTDDYRIGLHRRRRYVWLRKHGPNDRLTVGTTGGE